nr:hypothetical protein CFP56_37616 [Quercus suber]
MSLHARPLLGRQEDVVDKDLVLNLKWHSIVALQAVHRLEDRLKKANEEAEGEKAFKQVAESTFQEKTRMVAQAEKKLAIAKRA